MTTLFTPAVTNRAQEIAQLIQLLQQNSPNRNNLEHQLMMQRDNLQHMQALCHLIENLSKDPQHLGVALFSAVELKNICQINYKVWMQTQNSEIEAFLTEIRATIFELYMVIPHKSVSALLFECMEAFFGISYYPQCWPQFLELAKISLKKGNHEINLKVFKCLEALTKKYSREERSDPLYLEIIHVIDEMHDVVLEAIQAYLTALASGGLDSTLCLKCLRYLLQVFYHCIYQDIHPSVEDNISNWVQVLKGILNEELQRKVLSSASNSNETKNNIFNLKGECIKVILLINSKYKEDFDEYLQSFTEEIWSNCLGHNKAVEGKIVTYSIKYFKSFASNEKYTELFSQKMKEILVGLVLPNYRPIEEEFEVFENEPQNFTENIFNLVIRGLSPEREAIQEFVSSLGKFHSQSLVPLLLDLIRSLPVSDQQLSDNDLFQRVTLLNLLITSCSYSCNPREGILTISCPHELINNAFSVIALPLLTLLVSSIDQTVNTKILFVICHIIRFLNLFRYFLPFDKLYQIFQIILGKNIQSNKSVSGMISFEKCMYSWGTNLLNLKTFKVENKMNVNHEGMNFYQRFYVNPRVISVKVDRNKFSLPPTHPVLSAVCQSLYDTFTSQNSEVQEQTLVLFKTCLVRLGQNVLQVLDHLLKIYEQLVDKIISNKIPLNFGLINEIFESFGSLMQLSSSDPSSASKILGVLSRTPELFNKNVCEMHSLVIQVLTVFVRSFAVNVVPSLGKENAKVPPNDSLSELFQKGSLPQIVSSCLDQKNYQGELLKLNEIYLHLLSQSAFMCPSLITSEWASISNILKFLASEQMHISVIGFLRDLVVAGVVFPEMITFVIGYISQMTSTVADAQNLVELQIFFREMTLFLLNFIDINNMDNFIQIFTNMNAFPVLQTFFSNQNFLQFLSTFAGSINRKYLILIFTRLLLENPQKMMTVLTFPVYREVLNALVDNEYRRKFNFKSLRMSRRDNLNFRKRLAQKTGGIVGNVYFFKILVRPHKQRIREFIDMTREVVEESGTLLVNKLKQAIQNGMNAQEMLKPEYFKLLAN